MVVGATRDEQLHAKLNYSYKGIVKISQHALAAEVNAWIVAESAIFAKGIGDSDHEAGAEGRHFAGGLFQRPCVLCHHLECLQGEADPEVGAMPGPDQSGSEAPKWTRGRAGGRLRGDPGEDRESQTGLHSLATGQCVLRAV